MSDDVGSQHTEEVVGANESSPTAAWRAPHVQADGRCWTRTPDTAILWHHRAAPFIDINRSEAVESVSFNEYMLPYPHNSMRQSTSIVYKDVSC